MPTESTLTASRVPFEHDVFSNPNFGAQLPPQFGKARRFDWGIVVGAMPNSWGEPIKLEGIDWQVLLYPPRELKLPGWISPRSKRSTMREVRQHCAFVMSLVNAKTANDARDAGRHQVRSLLALIRRELPMIQPANLLWEGVVAQLPNGKVLLSAVDLQMMPRRQVDQDTVQRVRMRLVPLQVAKLSPAILRALHWMEAARAAKTSTEQFANLWVAAIALVKPGHPSGADDARRFRAYCDRMARPTGPYETSIADELCRRLFAAKKARERLMHRDESHLITSQLLDEFEQCLYSMIDFELLAFGIRLTD